MKLQAHWVPCSRRDLTVSSGPCGLTSLPAPVPLRVRVHPLVRFSPLQSPCRSKPTRYRSIEQPPLRFCSPSRYQQEESTTCEHPNLATFRPQRFTHSRRFTPPLTLQACFILQPRPGFTFQGFSSLPSRRTSSVRRTLMSFGSSRLSASFPTDTDSWRLAYRVLIQAAIRCN